MRRRKRKKRRKRRRRTPEQPTAGDVFVLEMVLNQEVLAEEAHLGG